MSKNIKEVIDVKNVITDDIFYDYHPALSHNCLFTFVVGNRGAGKTFGGKKWCIKAFKKTGAQFIYLRRYKSELEDISKFFDDIRDKFPDDELEVRGKKFYINGELAGYAIALSVALTKKSVSYHLVDKILYDEFIIDKGNIHYLKDEVVKFLEFYETVARLRDNVRAFFLSNAVSIANPYFIFWGIKPNPKKRFTKRGHLLIEFIQNEKFREAKYRTKFGQVIKGTPYGNYAVENEFLKDNNVFVEKKNGDARFEFSIIYAGITYGFWTDYKQGLCYVSNDYDPSSGMQFAITDSEHKPNMMLIKSASKSYSLSGAIKAYEGGWLRFEDMQIKNQTVEMFQLLRS